MSSNTFNVLVTGTNGGLGLGICLRLIDDFLKVENSSNCLNLIFTTRGARKGSATLKTLEAHLYKSHSPKQQRRVFFQNENVDLSSLLSVRDLARNLLDSDLPKLDAIVCNAGIGGWSDLDWVRATRDILLDLRNSTTWPEFKLGIAGSLTKPQLPSNTDSTDPEPPLGEIFCANLFGHYMLIHWLMPLFRACDQNTPAKIIWVSSIEPQDYHFQENDLQGLLTTSPYEHGKRLTDILVLTSNQPETVDSVTSFLSTPTDSKSLSIKPRPNTSIPSMHLFHPGILVTPIFPLPPVLFESYLAVIYIARSLGAVWSNVKPYTAAHGATHLLLTPDVEITRAEKSVSPLKTLDEPVARAAKVKWGTAINRLGKTTVRPTEVACWGLNGSGEGYVTGWWGGKGGLGRKPGAKEATGEDVRRFMGVGGRVWRDMERLRVEWEGRIEGASV